MKKKIQLYLILLAAAAVLLSTAAGVYITYNSLEKQVRQILKEEARGEAFRVTRIAHDGTVLEDNYGDPLSMDNHLDREEVSLALTNGEGSSIRKSDTVNKNAIYYAVTTSDGSVLRLAVDTENLWGILNETLPAAVIITILLILASIALAPRITRHIVEPMEDSLKNTDMGFTSVYDELIPFYIKLKEKDDRINSVLEDIKRRKQNMELVFTNMREGMIYLDRDRQIKLINPAAFHLFDLEWHDIRGQDLLYFSRDKKLAKAQRKAERGETYINHTQIGQKILQISAGPVFSNDEELKQEQVGAILLISDVTEQIKAEKIRRDFTANVSHELKTPLTSIMGYSELLAGEVARDDTVRFAGIIQKESRRLMSLISHILELSELEGSPGEGKTEEINLAEVVKECVESIQLRASERGITVTSRCEDCTVTADREAVLQIVRNLADNAVKYNRDGGEVCLSVECDAERAVLTVADTGIGISPENRERIFERFYRADKGRTSEGTGLGLAIVKHAAEKLDAVIELESEAGKGTVIRVKFPVIK